MNSGRLVLYAQVQLPAQAGVMEAVETSVSCQPPVLKFQ